MQIKLFKDLTGFEIYDILKLRAEVFIIEQNCKYLDPDNKDIHCAHLFHYVNDLLCATCRIIPPGISYAEASIGRVCVHPDFRRLSLGTDVMNMAIAYLGVWHPSSSIKISAQTYLKKFYEEFGFKVCGEEYLEDQLPHLPMIKLIEV